MFLRSFVPSRDRKAIQTQPGEEDFLKFCAEIGVSPTKVLGWLDESSLLEEIDLVGIAAILGEEVYKILNFPGIDPKLLEIYRSFAHLGGEERGKVASAVIEINSEEIQQMIQLTFVKWGII